MLHFWIRTTTMTAVSPHTGMHPLRTEEGEGTAGPAADRSNDQTDRQSDMHNSPNPVTDTPTTLQRRTAALSAQSSKRHRRLRLDRHGSEALQKRARNQRNEPRKVKRSKKTVERPARNTSGNRDDTISKPPCVSLSKR